MSHTNSVPKDIELREPPPVQAPSGGGGGDDRRLAAIEARLAGLDAHLQHLATKEDIQAMQSSMLKWGIGTIIALAALVCTSVLIMLRASG